jgi:hypothetical protein
MKIARIALPVLLFALAGAVPSFAAGPLTVELKNDDSRSISVHAGAADGVTPESDFEVVLGGDQSVPVFPAEIFKDRFWSAPLSQEDYDSIRLGAPVRQFTADKTSHRLMRKLAAEQKKTLRREQDEATRADVAKKVAALRDRRARLQAEKEKLDGWIASADRGLAGEKDRQRWLDDSAERDIARSQQRIDDLTDRRNELQAQREALPRKDSAGRERLTGQITSLNASIASERDSLRASRDRKRDSRTFLDRDLTDKRKMQADRDAIDVEIRALDREIAGLQGR